MNISADHIEITLMSSTDIQQLNHDYFDNNCPTDTITFNLDGHDKITGIYVCPDVIQSNAIEWNTDLEEEFKIVLIHSILYLIGYTDTTEATFSKMKSKQIEIYNALTK